MADNQIKLVISIDGKDANATINLTDQNIKELYKSFKYGEQEVNGLTTAISQGFNNAREIIQGFSEAYNVISQAFATHLTAYQEQEDALIKLNTALRQSGQFTEENTKSLTDFAAQLQKTTVYGEEVTETVMAQLLAMGLSIEQTKQATLQAANLATVMGTDLNTAARAMADLFNGNVGTIGRYIKGLDETIIKSGDLDKIMAMLNERIGGQAEAMGKSASGQIARMNNAIGDLKKNAGQLLSNALSPMIGALANIAEKINNLSPELSGIIGIIASVTTAFVTLRVTGILPAIQSIEFFGVALTGLKATLIKTGIGALIIALGYGLYELSKAYEHFNQVSEQGNKSYQNMLDAIKDDALKAKKEELKWMLSDAEKQRDKLKADLEKLKVDIQNAKEKVVTKDKEGYEYVNYYETETSKNLTKQLEQTKQLLKLEEDKIKIYNEINNQKTTTKKLTEEELKALFEKNKIELAEAQRHQEAMLKIHTDNDYLILSQKIQHFNQMIELYRKFGQDVTNLVNQRTEAEAELNKKFSETIPENFEPKNLETGLKKNLKLVEINAEETNRITKEHKEQESKIAELTTADKLNLLDQEKEKVAETLGAIGGMFAQHTLAYQAFAKAQALIDTYTAAEAAYKALVGIPIVGPALAVAAAAAAIVAGLQRVEQIGKVQIPGYALGGRLPKGESGFVEGYHNEIIAPEKTFVEVFKQELRPQIYGSNGTVNYDLSGIKDSINKLNRLIEQGIVARAYLDNREARKITVKGNYLNNKSKL